MSKIHIIFFLAASILFSSFSHLSADEHSSYKELMDLGKAAMCQNNFRKAMVFFSLAHYTDPVPREPLAYLNSLKKLKKRRIARALIEAASLIKKGQGITTEHFDTYGWKIPQRIVRQYTKARPEEVITANKSDIAISQDQRRIELDDTLWTTRTKINLDIELNKSVILQGQDISRYLVITPGFIEVERLDKDQIKVRALNRGTTSFHVWDIRGRWTFYVRVIFASQLTAIEESPPETIEEYAKPWRFRYNADWNSFYLGNSLPRLERRNLHFLQWTAVEGETPYGQFDTYALFNKFKESTEVTSYAVGLTDGQIGNFQDFTIRGFDTAKRFSALTLPGKYFRGALLEAKAFEEKIDYSLLWGKDRATFGFVSPGVLEERASFLEGARVTFFPEERHQYAVNYARGYGPARDPLLKERVYSLEARHTFDQLNLSGEIASDEEEIADLVMAEFGDYQSNLKINFRNIEKDFATVTGFPSGRGEIGGNVIYNLNQEKVRFNSNLDFYRDRFLFNPDRMDVLNLDWSSSAHVPLSATAGWRTSLFYVDTPGLISPRENITVNNTYDQSFRLISNKTLSTFIGNSYQRSRFELNESSDFDRYGVTAGFRLPLIRNLSYSFQYEYSWLAEIFSRDHLNPYVFNTGLNYARELSSAWSINSGFSYRNEEDTEASHSFLAGEDSITGNIRLFYHPTEDFEFFIDGRMRNVWAESPRNTAFHEADIRFGVKSSWELPFHWNPTGEVGGTVFKDLNSNNKRERNEPGIPGVKINVGDEVVTTNQYGRYHARVHAKSVRVGVATDTFLEGFTAVGPLLETVEIVAHMPQVVNFGFMTHSKIHGVVYFDKNRNGKWDPAEILIAKVKMILDDQEEVMSNYAGVFTFNDIVPGRHLIRLDVSSLPLEYLPLIKIKNKIEIVEGTTYIFNVPVTQR